MLWRHRRAVGIVDKAERAPELTTGKAELLEPAYVPDFVARASVPSSSLRHARGAA
jgi:hypothetical protein